MLPTVLKRKLNAVVEANAGTFLMSASILQHLRTNGEQLDAEIAGALRMTHAQVASHIAQLSAAGEVICCKVTRYNDGKKIEGVSCRLSAYVPPRATGPKPGAKRAAGDSAEPEEDIS